MDHSEATNIKAAERYVLGDLSVSEVEEFERHFFDCPQCSEELRMLAVLQDNARAVFAEPDLLLEPSRGPQIAVATEPVNEKTSWWSFWKQPWAFAPALAAVVVAVFAGYETGVRTPSQAPQSVAAYPLYAASRGEETVIAPPRSSEFYTLYMDRTWDRDYESYTASLREDPGGAEKTSMKLGPLPQGRSIQILVPTKSLQSGKYVLVISGSDGAEVARYPFRLQF
jgi:anti-sigma-K factor RskA